MSLFRLPLFRVRASVREFVQAGFVARGAAPPSCLMRDGPSVPASTARSLPSGDRAPGESLTSPGSPAFCFPEGGELFRLVNNVP
jgi:hypothetical protein